MVAQLLCRRGDASAEEVARLLCALLWTVAGACWTPCGAARAGGARAARVRTRYELASGPHPPPVGQHPQSLDEHCRRADRPGRCSATRYRISSSLLSVLLAFNPDQDGEAPPREVRELRQEISDADAVLFCTSEYPGAMPISLKNLREWTVSSGELYGKPVAWINVAAPGRGDRAYREVTRVLGYVGARIVEPACVRARMTRDAVGLDGIVADAGFRSLVLELLEALADHVRNHS